LANLSDTLDFFTKIFEKLKEEGFSFLHHPKLGFISEKLQFCGDNLSLQIQAEGSLEFLKSSIDCFQTNKRWRIDNNPINQEDNIKKFIITSQPFNQTQDLLNDIVEIVENLQLKTESPQNQGEKEDNEEKRVEKMLETKEQSENFPINEQNVNQNLEAIIREQDETEKASISKEEKEISPLQSQEEIQISTAETIKEEKPELERRSSLPTGDIILGKIEETHPEEEDTPKNRVSTPSNSNKILLSNKAASLLTEALDSLQRRGSKVLEHSTSLLSSRVTNPTQENTENLKEETKEFPVIIHANSDDLSYLNKDLEFEQEEKTKKGRISAIFQKYMNESVKSSRPSITKSEGENSAILNEENTISALEDEGISLTKNEKMKFKEQRSYSAGVPFIQDSKELNEKSGENSKEV